MNSLILAGGADHLATVGHTRQSFYDGRQARGMDDGVRTPPRRCRACALGAINVAGGAAPDALLAGDRLSAAVALADHIGADLKDPTDCELIEVLGHWNDTHTEEQVIAELRACAEAERKAGR